MVEFSDEHGGHAVQRGAALFADGLQGGHGLEGFARKHHGGARGHAGQHRQHHAKAVVQRHGNAQAVVLGEIHRLGDEARVVHHVVVRERGALGVAGGAAGELDVDGVMARQACAQSVQRWRIDAGTALRQHAGVVEHAGRVFVAQADHHLQRRQARRLQRSRRATGQLGRQALQHLQVFGTFELLGGDDGTAARKIERVFQLGHAVGRVDVDQHQPGARRGKLRHQPLGAVGRPDAYAVAHAQAQGNKARRQRIDLGLELLPAPAHALLAKDHGRPISKTLHRRLQKLADGQGRERGVLAPLDL